MTRRTRIALLAALTALVVALAVVVIVAGQTGTAGRSDSPGRSGAESGADVGLGSGFDGAALPPGVRAHPFTLTALASPAGAGPSSAGGTGSSHNMPGRAEAPAGNGPGGGPGGGPGNGPGNGPGGGSGGETVSLDQFAGRVVVLAFMYPGCGRTCTLIADQIRGALDELREQPAVVIVDASEREGTRAGARARGQRFLEETSLAGRAYFLSGSASQLKAVWRAYGIVPASAGRARFDDYAQVLLIDGHGHERVLFGMENLTAEGLAHDVGTLQTG